MTDCVILYRYNNTLDMFDQLDPRSPTPLYEQIAQRIRVAIASGEVHSGTALPSVRSLATQLRINPATVVQAYRDLEAGGFVTRRHGSGTYVNDLPEVQREDERAARASELVEELLITAARHGLTAEDLIEAFEKHVGERL